MSMMEKAEYLYETLGKSADEIYGAPSSPKKSKSGHLAFFVRYLENKMVRNKAVCGEKTKTKAKECRSQGGKKVMKTKGGHNSQACGLIIGALDRDQGPRGCTQRRGSVSVGCCSKLVSHLLRRLGRGGAGAGAGGRGGARTRYGARGAGPLVSPRRWSRTEARARVAVVGRG